MPRVETRVTSVQVVPGFPACFAIPNPPGWDPLSTGYCSPNASANTLSCQSQARDVGEDTDDSWFSSTPDLFWPPDLSLPRSRTPHIEALSVSGVGEMGAPVDATSAETTPYQQFMVPFSLHVSRAVLPYHQWSTDRNIAPSIQFSGRSVPVPKSCLRSYRLSSSHTNPIYDAKDREGTNISQLRRE